MTVPGEATGVEFVTVRDVELVKEGEWPAVTGPATITPEKLKSMMEAAKAGIFEDAPMKIGHFDPRFSRFDGNPALGWIDNVRVAGKSLIGDFIKVPAKFAPLLDSAYRKRSIEWEEDVTAPDGTKYPAVLKAVALLGANEPAVTGLKDVMNVFAAAFGSEPAGDRNLQIAFLGDDSVEIAQCLSRLTDLIQKSGDDGHDTDLGGNVADLSDARVRELLDLSADADLETELAALKGLKPAASGEQPKTGAEPKTTEAPATEPKIGEDPKVDEQPAPGTADGVLVPAAVLAELQRQAALGVSAHQQLTEGQVDAELKAAAKAGQIAPSEFDALREQLLDPAQAAGTRKALSVRPAILQTASLGDPAINTSPTDDAAFTSFVSGIFGGDLATIGKGAK